MKHFIFSSAFFLIFLFSEYSFCQINLGQSVDSLIRVTNPRFFNGVILVSKNGESIYEKTHGYSSLVKKISLKMEDQFLIGSISKQFTATLVLREIQAGHIQAHQTIGHYLPDFKQRWADSVTVQQLLNHTSGIIHWDNNLAYEPGSKFSYSNINYAILGAIIEKTSGQTYSVLTADLFEHCKMKSSTVPPGSGRKSNHKKLVKGHSESGNKKYVEENILNLLDSPMMGVPASGMISTAGDLAKWMSCLHNGELLADSTYQMMINHAVIRSHRWGEVKYADGIQVDHLDGITELSMSGYVPGFISTMIYYPKTKVSIVILENISPLSSDMNRVFYFHDQIRKMVRTSF
ncbi:serine hydrolase domain-containing protein [Pedobacter sp. AW31-3R]|uniref:serine hydrolase domain-containing protein n=1 Tax=Pedobacter sp. AW31-3R TaxID=3445781 RepID=UPI003FA1191D